MQKSHKIIIGVTAGVLALGAIGAIAGPPIYRDFIAAQAADVPSLPKAENNTDAPAVNEDTAGQPLDAASIAGAWSVAAGSEAGYRVEEVLSGTNVTVTGRTSDVTGTFTVSADGRTLEAADLSVDVASIATDEGQRDNYFRENVMNVSKNPKATFTLTKPVTLDAVPNSNASVSAEVEGNLTLAGVTKPVTFGVEMQSDGKAAHIAGAIPITFADFGITAPNLGFVSVDPNGQVEFQLTATHK